MVLPINELITSFFRFQVSHNEIKRSQLLLSLHYERFDHNEVLLYLYKYPIIIHYGIQNFRTSCRSAAYEIDLNYNSYLLIGDVDINI